MSAGQTPRRPEYFPRMKDRAWKRRHRKVPVPRLADLRTVFRKIGVEAASLFASVARAGMQAAAVLTNTARIVENGLWLRDEQGARWVRAAVRHPQLKFWRMEAYGSNVQVADETIARMGEVGAFRYGAEVVVNATTAVKRYPHVDADIIVAVDQANPKDVGQRVAMERTLQDRRNAGLIP